MKEKNKSNDGFSFHSLKDWKEAGESLIKEASASVKEKTADLRKKSLDEISQDMKTYVKKNPLKSLLMALGLGLFLGFILKRRD